MIATDHASADWLARMRAVPGWLEPDEAVLLHDLAARLHDRGRCVELGAYQGRSSIALAAAIPAGEAILSIDTFTGSPEHQPGHAYFDPSTLQPGGSVDTIALFRRHVADAGFADRVEAWRMRTTEAAERFAGRVALLFVDADHAYEATCADVAAWRRHLADCAVIVLHDVGDWPGPTRCAADLLQQGCTRLDQAGTALALTTPPDWARG